jgi:hypothetical protein
MQARIIQVIPAVRLNEWLEAAMTGSHAGSRERRPDSQLVQECPDDDTANPKYEIRNPQSFHRQPMTHNPA